MILLKQSTAVILKLGPFVDSTDGVTPETALTIAQADIQISKAGGAFAQTSATTPTTTHDADGWYPIPLTTTDTATLGGLVVQVAMAGALPVWAHAMVVPANVYDALVGGSDVLQVDVTQVEGSDATTYLEGLDDPTLAAVAALNDLDAAGVRSAVGLAAANLDTQLAALPTAAENAGQVWDEAKAAHVGAGSFGEEVQAHALSSEVAALNDPTAAAVADAVWDEAIAGHAAAGSTGEALAGASAPTAAAVADAVWDEAIAGHAAAGSTGEALAAAAASGIAGPGATSYVIAVNDGALPIQGAEVWVSTDAAGSNVVAGPLQTDSNGEVTFLLDLTTYYAWVRKDGYNPVTASSFTVV